MRRGKLPNTVPRHHGTREPKELSVPEKSQQKKSPRRMFDFFGMSAAGVRIERTPETTRSYAKRLYAAGTPGIFRVSNHDFIADEQGIAALAQEAATRAARG